MMTAEEVKYWVVMFGLVLVFLVIAFGGNDGVER